LCGIIIRMTAWKDVEEAVPEFAARVRKIFEAHKHKTIATLRADGGPRISGIEAEFVDGELRFGSMPNARKGADLHRDPRFALHSPSVDPPKGDPAGWAGDAKIAGRAHAVGPVDGAGDGEQFHADIDEVVRIGLNADATKLVIETWTPDGGLRRVERE
jgi:Pyridoxamine 5'-phosphate oxidase